MKRGFEEMSGVQIGGLSALIYNVQSISVDGIKGIQADWKISQFISDGWIFHFRK